MIFKNPLCCVGNIWYLNCSGGFVGVYNCQNLQNFILNECSSCLHKFFLSKVEKKFHLLKNDFPIYLYSSKFGEAEEDNIEMSSGYLGMNLTG